MISLDKLRLTDSRTALKFLLAAGLIILSLSACDHGMGPVGAGPTGLRGRVTLLGDWPLNTGIVAVALFIEKPVSSESDFPVVFELAPADSSQFDYEWEFSTGGVFGYLVVVWLAEGASLFDLTAWVEIGLYAESESPGQPGEVLITPGEFLRIDLTGDFSRVPGTRQDAEGKGS